MASLLLAACTGESSRPVATGKGQIRALNTMPTSPDVLFLIEERPIGSVVYATSAPQDDYDDLEYIFNFDAQFPDTLLRQRVASSAIKIEADREYTFLITGDLAAPTIIVWDEISRQWEGTETDFQVKFGHTAESLGPIDVYFAAPGIAPAAGEEKGTLSFGELLAPVDYEAGDFVYTITTAGNPNDVLFTSNAINTIPQFGFTITPFDATANDLGTLAVRILTDGGVVSGVSDANASSTIRFIHASANMDTADVYTDELLTDQILSNHAFRDVTDDIDLANGSYPITYTSVGNVGSILHESSVNILPASRVQFYVVGGDQALISFSLIPNRRSVETLVKLSFVHSAVNHTFVDLYIVEAGTDIEDVQPTLFAISVLNGAIGTSIATGDLEFYLTAATEKTPIVGPIALSTSLGDVLELISYDNVDPATADLIFIPLP